MAELAKATLVRIPSDNSESKDTPVEVQFNPTTMKLQISSNLAKGSPAGSQQRQATGSSSTTLTLDLVFDTADEIGAEQKPRSVREKTAIVEQFVVPDTKTQGKQKPPKVRFQWGSFYIDGVMDDVNIDFDLFASDGTPLRAKVSVVLKEQNSKYMFLKAGAGANQAGNAPAPPDTGSGTPGTAGGPSNQVAPALNGESLPEFATRQGLDPQAWRGLSTDFGGGLSGELSLQAGVEVGFSADLSVNAGIGVSLGVEAGVSASLESSFGLEVGGAGIVAGIGVDARLAAGFSLAAAGGVGSAIASVQNAKSEAASQQARQAFGQGRANTPSPESTARPALPDQDHTPLAVSGIPLASQQKEAPKAPPPPKVDSRAASFGFGVPLRPVVGEARDSRAGFLSGRVPLAAQTGDGLPQVTDDPTTPPWVALQRRTPPTASNAGSRGKVCGCGCGGTRRH